MDHNVRTRMREIERSLVDAKRQDMVLHDITSELRSLCMDFPVLCKIPRAQLMAPNHAGQLYALGLPHNAFERLQRVIRRLNELGVPMDALEPMNVEVPAIDEENGHSSAGKEERAASPSTSEPVLPSSFESFQPSCPVVGYYVGESNQDVRENRDDGADARGTSNSMDSPKPMNEQMPAIVEQNGRSSDGNEEREASSASSSWSVPVPPGFENMGPSYPGWWRNVHGSDQDVNENRRDIDAIRADLGQIVPNRDAETSDNRDAGPVGFNGDHYGAPVIAPAAPPPQSHRLSPHILNRLAQMRNNRNALRARLNGDDHVPPVIAPAAPPQFHRPGPQILNRIPEMRDNRDPRLVGLDEDPYVPPVIAPAAPPANPGQRVQIEIAGMRHREARRDGFNEDHNVLQAAPAIPPDVLRQFRQLVIAEYMQIMEARQAGHNEDRNSRPAVVNIAFPRRHFRRMVREHIAEHNHGHGIENNDHHHIRRARNPPRQNGGIRNRPQVVNAFGDVLSSDEFEDDSMDESGDSGIDDTVFEDLDEE